MIRKTAFQWNAARSVGASDTLRSVRLGLLAFLAIAALTMTAAAMADECQSNFDCNWWSEFCLKDQGDCDGEGQCATRPMFCLDVWIPVCGCDGQTYSNSCYAHRSGVNVAHEGGCNGEGGGPVILMGIGDDERVGAPHLLALLNRWGECTDDCSFDFTGDELTEVEDLLILLDHWDWRLQ